MPFVSLFGAELERVLRDAILNAECHPYVSQHAQCLAIRTSALPSVHLRKNITSKLNSDLNRRLMKPPLQCTHTFV
ncbi:hypothetical protein ACHAWF_015660 [Thalassiosira exigua]